MKSRSHSFVTIMLATSALAGVVHAQAPQASAVAAPDAVSEVIVTGQRLAFQRSINAKRSDIHAQDTVSADEVGTLPDFGLGEALTRVPGITLLQNNQRGESQFINIRGLNSDYSIVEVDGIPLSTTETTRRNLSLDVLPASLSTSITVDKSLTADMDGNAIGGTVNLHTRSAFDVPGAFAAVRGDLGRYDNERHKSSPTPSGLIESSFSTRFGPGDKFGAVLDASYFRRDSSSLDSDTDNYLFYTPQGAAVSTASPAVAGATAVPDRRRWLTYDNVRDRTSLLGKLEYSDGERLSAHVTGAYFQHNNDEHRDSNILLLSGTPTLTAGGGSAASGSGQVDYDHFFQNRRIEYVDVGVSYKLTPVDTLDFRANESIGLYKQDTLQDIYTTGGATPNLSYKYTLKPGQYTVFTPNNPTFYYDPSNYKQTQFGTAADTSHESALLLRGDYSHDANDLIKGLSFKAGGEARLAHRTVAHTENYYQPVTGAVFTLAGALNSNTTYPYDGNGQHILLIDEPLAISVFNNSSAKYVIQSNHLAQNLNSNYKIDEDIYSGYGLIRYEHGAIHADVGIRVEDTDLETHSYASNAGVYTYAGFSNTYVKPLPSANLAFDVTPDVKLRFNYNEALGRANYNQLAQGQAVTNSPGAISISAGNPKLKPRDADNYNAALDWYFARDGLVSGAIFYKKVNDEIVNAISQSTQIVGGISIPVTTNTPQNVSKSEISGIELSFVKTHFNQLPGLLRGFGFAANAMFINTDNPTILMNDKTYRKLRGLVETANNVENVQLLYQLGKFDAVLAYNHTGKLLLSVATDLASNDRTLAPSDTLDLQLRYHLTERLAITASGKNITNDRPQRLVGPQQNLLREELDNGASYFLGASYKF